MLELVALRSLRRDARVQREAGTVRNISPRLVRLRRQRLQREDLLPLAWPRRDPGMTAAYFEPEGTDHGSMIAPTVARALEYFDGRSKSP
jgi:hypothetical protein